MLGLERNIFSGSVLAVCNTAIILVTYPLYLKYLGTERYGLWATLSVVVNFASIGSLGMDTAMIKYIAEEYGKNDSLGIERYFSTAIIALLTGGVLISLMLISLRGLLINTLKIPEGYILLTNRLLPCMVTLSILIFLVKVVDGTLRGLGRVDMANYCNLSVRIISIIIVIILLSSGHGIWSLLWGQVLLYVLLGLLALYIIYRQLGTSFFSVGSFSLTHLRKMSGFGGTMTAAQLISIFLTPFNKAVIARYIGLSSVTYFEIASKTIMQLRSVFDMGLKAIMPEVSGQSVCEDAKVRIDRIFGKTMALILYLGVPIFAISFVFGPILLQLWLTDRYTPIIGSVFRIILLGYVVNLLVIPAYYLLMGMGKASYCFVNHLVQAIFNASLISVAVALGITNLYLFVGIYSLSVALSAVVLLILFALYQRS